MTGDDLVGIILLSALRMLRFTSRPGPSYTLFVQWNGTDDWRHGRQLVAETG